MEENMQDNELSSVELFEETKIKITKFLAQEGCDMNDYLNWFQNFYNLIKNYSFSKHNNEERQNGNKKGGMDFIDKVAVDTLRGVGWDLIKQIGKKIISGDFNLTTISMPIKVMIPLTILQTIALSVFNYPYFLHIANFYPDPVEKMKFVITACISCFHKSSHFKKPMNPILGETFDHFFEDGSRIYLEQTSHHPPISHYIMYGPNDSYKYFGYSSFASSAGFNSLKVLNKGKRSVLFKDGTKIDFNFCHELFSNCFWGTVKLESLGEIHFKDELNQMECTIKFDSVKKKPTDFFSGEIKQDKKVISKAYGTYLGFIEFDNVRYWDIRENVYLKVFDNPGQLLSSSLFREDRIYLEKKNLEKGQFYKEKLENLQRHDRKLREVHEKQVKKESKKK